MNTVHEKKNATKYKILNYMFHHGETSKAELTKKLGISVPTVLSNVNELIARGIVREVGEFESLGEEKQSRWGFQKIIDILLV